ncbi:hypothetical protein CIRG_02373 [Coccidioides immitis RMSCC 2394]|uniref:Uncharacterized protein n=1 Tax=Coccidioides immitis RMSCC 2394 TaxID=404692 RepID=A0A0J6Y231_COCIT|nr:hypothetical protein CIRG_02373 [Coccidioides immitis RMSCC 2394]
MFLNAYKLFGINRQKNNNYIFAKSFLTKQELIWDEMLRSRESLLLLILLISFMEDTSNGNKCTLQYSDIGTLNDSILRLVDIKNINLKHIHNLTNKISDVDRDNRDNRNNEANRDNKDNRDDEDNKDNGKEQFSCS